MYKVFIVDDDILTRMNLKMIIDWNYYGFDICGEAANGQNAIDMLKDCNPDVILTDMKMPVMDGVALIEWICMNRPWMQIIALSGHDDFNYVKDSMKLGAIDYIIKNKLEAELLLSVLEVAKSRIIKRREELREKTHVENQLQLAKGHLRQQFLRSLLYGEVVDTNEIKQNIERLQLNIELFNLVVIVLEIDDYYFLLEKESEQDVKKRIIDAFVEIVQQILNDSKQAYIVHLEQGKFAILFSIGKSYSTLFVYNQLYQLIERIRMSIKRYLNLTACFGVSPVCPNLSKSNQYYNKANRLLEEKFYKGKDQMFMDLPEKIIKNDIMTLTSEQEKAILMSLKTFDQEKLTKTLDEIFDDVIKKRLHHNATHMIVAELINIACRVANQSGIKINEIFYANDVPYSKMQKYDNIMDVKNWITDIHKQLLLLLEENMYNTKNYSENTRKALDYIHRNYHKDMSLQDTARYINVSCSYLSRIFKEECKVSYSRYLNQLRIDKAKILIENGDVRIKDIIRQVGFQSYNYFFKVFKELVNMTPLEYEDMVKSRMTKK
ncbi:MAG: response regulator [Anaerolineaceae bacterium]|nr:MAG: response regulator [Anaerolineaceae bacterium]